MYTRFLVPEWDGRGYELRGDSELDHAAHGVWVGSFERTGVNGRERQDLRLAALAWASWGQSPGLETGALADRLGATSVDAGSSLKAEPTSHDLPGATETRREEHS